MVIHVKRVSDAAAAGPISRGARKAMLDLVVLCLAVPVTIGRVFGVEIPLSEVVVLTAIPFYFVTPMTREKGLLTAAIAASILALFGAEAMGLDREVRPPLLSLAYFYLPYLPFFAGYKLVRDVTDLNRIVRLMAWISVAVAVVVTLSIVASGEPVRVERVEDVLGVPTLGATLNGSLLGMPLYARWGVISLAVYYGTMLEVILVRLWYLRPPGVFGVTAHIVGAACVAYLVVGSLSRTVILGLLVFVLVMAGDAMRQSGRRGVVLTLGICAAASLWVWTSVGGLSGESTLSLEIRRHRETLESGDIEAFSTGRLTLATAAIADLARSPLTGSGFHGFDPKVEWNNSSPHNQYLTALWKMGFPAAVFYFAFLYRCLRNLNRLRKTHRSTPAVTGLFAIVLSYALGFCMTWDVLLVPLTGSLVMFLLGATTKSYYLLRLRGAGPSRSAVSNDTARAVARSRVGRRVGGWV